MFFVEWLFPEKSLETGCIMEFFVLNTSEVFIHSLFEWSFDFQCTGGHT